MPSNVENILGAILTGDGSGIQKPASRVEELLFEIYEQGGGGGGDSVIGGIKLTIDSNYVMTATLVDKDGEEYGVSDDIDLPLEEMVVDAEYDPQTQKIKLELKNGNYVEFSVAELVSGLQTELSSSNKLNPAYIDYDASHRAVSDTEKNTWNAKQNAISDLETIRSGAAAGATAVQPATMEAALALKQDSLSETQLAAVNSGIDSAKVAQISTNQSNILYTQESTIGENLIPCPYYRSSPYTNAGVTFTYGEDGIITLNRATTGTAAAYISLLQDALINEDDIGKYVTMSISNTSNVAVHIYIKDSGGTVIRDLSVTSKLTFAFQSGESSYTIGLWTNTSATFDNVKLSIMLEKGSVAHPYQPYMLSRQNLYKNTPSMSVSNSKTLTTSKGYCYLTDWTKNLLNANLDLYKKMNSDRTWDSNSTTYRGVTYTVDDTTHSITFDGTSSSSSTSRIYLSPVFETTKYSDYWAVGVNTSDTAVGFGFTYCQNPDGTTWLKDEIDQGVGTKVNTEYPYFRVTIKVEKGHTADNLSVQPMFMKGTTPHAYVPYDGYTVTSSNSNNTESHSVFVGTETPSPVMLKTYEDGTVITSLGEIEVVIPNNTQAKAVANSDVITHEDRNALVEVVDSSAKNLIPAQFVTSTYNGASFVWGENGSFTASRVSEGVYTTYNILKNFELPVGHYVLSIGSALIENYEVRLVLSDSSTKTLDSTTDTYVDFTITQGLSINYLYISVGTNATSSVTIYPMICSKANWDISSKYKPYVPYDISKVVETNSTVNNDLNNCIDTSVVYRCVNSSSLPANCPNFKFNNISSFEMTCTTPAVNMILQELKPNSIATLPRIYYRRRTGVGTEQSPYVWSNWETMNCRYPVISGINYNDCDETGFYEVMGTTTANTQNSPNGNNASNNFFVIVQRRDAVYIKQIACDVRTSDVYNRNCINGTWGDWVKLATASDIAALDIRIQALENA